MNQEQLNAIKERVAKATPGPWESEGTFEGHNDIFNPDEAYVICQTGNENYDCLNDGDTEFIKHAITDVPALVTEVERLNNQIHVYQVTDEFVREQSKKVKHLFPLENVAGYGQLCDLVVEQEKKMILLREVVKEFIDYWSTTNDARPLAEIVTDAHQALGGEAHE